MVLLLLIDIMVHLIFICKKDSNVNGGLYWATSHVGIIEVDKNKQPQLAQTG